MREALTTEATAVPLEGSLQSDVPETYSLQKGIKLRKQTTHVSIASGLNTPTICSATRARQKRAKLRTWVGEATSRTELQSICRNLA